MPQLLRKVLWWVCLLVAPAVLLGIELFHPANFTVDPGMFQYLRMREPYSAAHKALAYPGPKWWFVLHMIQTPMIALVAVGLFLMASRVRPVDWWVARTAAYLSVVATFVFAVYYTVLDAIGGVGLGRTIEIVNRLAASSQLSPTQVLGVRAVLNGTWTDHWVGGVGSVVSQTGSWAVFSAALLLAIGLLLSKRAPWPPLIGLVAFGYVLQLTHAMPYGPIAFGLLIISAGWIRLWADRHDAPDGTAERAPVGSPR
ncbi:MAG TPA: hypothetical protein VHA57_07720 [Actinomycetota bacterium]|nr:hypothetical protein [Actinomycetota bacterium]